MTRPFYGWRIVAACMLLATVSWALGVFGMSVYVHALTTYNGFSLSAVSTAVTIAFMTSAVMSLGVGGFTARHGPKPVVFFGATATATGAFLLPYCASTWQLYPVFFLIGSGIACLSTTMIGTTLAPWFERLQGRAMSTAMLGASLGGIFGTPVLMAGIAAFGFRMTMLMASVAVLAVMIPTAVFVLIKQPQDIGQWPDGESSSPGIRDASAVLWTRASAFRTSRFQTQIVAFGVALLVQVGFLSHHVPIALPVLGPAGAATAVSAAAVAAFVGRVLLARYVDRIDPRRTAAGVFLLASCAFTGMALSSSPLPFMAFSVLFGLTVGNVTTLAPIIIRREFGAASFGQVYGLAAMCNQMVFALGPTMFGVLRDEFGTYSPVLYLSAMLDLVAAAVVLWGGERKRTV